MSPRPTAGIATVRLVIDGLRHAVQAALDSTEATWRESVRHHVEEAVVAFDFAGEVAREVQAALRREIRRVVEGAVYAALRDSPIVGDLVRQAMTGLTGDKPGED